MSLLSYLLLARDQATRAGGYKWNTHSYLEFRTAIQTAMVDLNSHFYKMHALPYRATLDSSDECSLELWQDPAPRLVLRSAWPYRNLAPHHIP